jgi:hypothetical protein
VDNNSNTQRGQHLAKKVDFDMMNLKIGPQNRAKNGACKKKVKKIKK